MKHLPVQQNNYWPIHYLCFEWRVEPQTPHYTVSCHRSPQQCPTVGLKLKETGPFLNHQIIALYLIQQSLTTRSFILGGTENHLKLYPISFFGWKTQTKILWITSISNDWHKQALPSKNGVKNQVRSSQSRCHFCFLACCTFQPLRCKLHTRGGALMDASGQGNTSGCDSYSPRRVATAICEAQPRNKTPHQQSSLVAHPGQLDLKHTLEARSSPWPALLWPKVPSSAEMALLLWALAQVSPGDTTTWGSWMSATFFCSLCACLRPAQGKEHKPYPSSTLTEMGLAPTSDVINSCKSNREVRVVCQAHQRDQSSTPGSAICSIRQEDRGGIGRKARNKWNTGPSPAAHRQTPWTRCSRHAKLGWTFSNSLSQLKEFLWAASRVPRGIKSSGTGCRWAKAPCK